MKSYTLLCFFLSLAMILCPLCSVEKATAVIADELFGDEEIYGEDDFDSPVSASTVKVMSADSKNITETSLREYLIGTVAEEMSPTYHEEALKAQAVAAHTMLEYSKKHKTDTLGDADITDSSAAHQGYLTKDEQQKKWGENYEKYRTKIENAVDEVIGITIQYNGEEIAAAFHAISNGTTENAADVWGGNYPYLISVESAGDKLSTSYLSALTVTQDEFKSLLEQHGAVLSGKPEEWVGEIKNTDTGMVKTVSICGKEFKGTDIRNIFQLKSSTFKITYKDESFTFSVSGYGHGVGMSQYGADFMARQGCNFKEILTHYYPNTQLKG